MFGRIHDPPDFMLSGIKHGLLQPNPQNYLIIMANPESSFTKVADTTEILAGNMKMVKVKDEEILIVNVDNKYYAVSNPCPHKKGDLSKGTLEGKILTCPIHGSKFDVTTGKNTLGPKQMMFRGSTGDLKTYELRIEGGSISVYKRSSWGI
jgi:nitrite reductase/ring-hydroxylating ferredoxin subunit